MTTRKKTASGGFTLLEVVMVMALTIAVFGVALVASDAGKPEKALREAIGAPEDLIREARRLSLLQQRTYAVEFREGSVTLSPRGRSQVDGLSQRVVGSSRERFSFDAPEDPDAAERQRTFPEVRRTRKIDEDYVMEVKRWGARDFRLIEEDVVETLVFEPSGLVEPATLRISKGETFISVELSPLSGAARGEELYISK